MKNLVLCSMFFLLGACGGSEDSGANAAQGPAPAAIVEAFRAKGLVADNARDNSGSCTFPDQPESSCVALTTTDQVSIYLWPSSDAAERSATGESCAEPFLRENGGIKCNEVIGSHVLRFGGDIDFPVMDAQPYVEVARALID